MKRSETTGSTPHVAVIGLGYIGLPTAAVLAAGGADVTGMDVNPRTVDFVNRGEVPFVEPDLGTVLAGAVSQGRLRATSEVPAADAYIVAVPTPFAENHNPDLSYIRAAAESIAPQLTGGELVILESTSPPGATEHMAEVILEARSDLTLEPNRPNTVYFAHCPERVLPGRIIVELSTNDRIIGSLNGDAGERARDLYRLFCDGEFHITDARTAEMAKLVENAYRDVNIAFANELSVVASKLNVDVWELIDLANHHPRVNILQPGPGVGGHCIAVDPWFLVAAAPEDTPLIRTAREVNDNKPEFVLNHVVPKAQRFKEPRVAVLGLAFKPDIDDLRESPAMYIAETLADRLSEGTILAVEPNIDELPASLVEKGNVELTDLETAVQTADIVLLLVDHSEFKNYDQRRLQSTIVYDTRGTWRTLL
ncbi:UDP-N-acetyl-D-mannosamine dehydrogenase [Brevibacterium luteolum]|uniref:UDP-N-acetyl-D-mannosamine dehydrogenase n=1 Tax=Brevibacterium luteolum TaxID=199591 RepID=UPI0021AF0E1E|nr:UDP-N-acetyl-D-mannosamine dehydrogenase [Brevibacterium luteolum]MCT1656931.1 UDP-N-acetyl-D-mannosamine dehydrogenase [Brevibacterium luteolum]